MWITIVGFLLDKQFFKELCEATEKKEKNIPKAIDLRRKRKESLILIKKTRNKYTVTSRSKSFQRKEISKKN